MLATLYRHTRRYDEAAKQLDRLDRLDEAVKWRWEIERERELLKRKAALGTENDEKTVETKTV
jgi:cytochrome c-type biogenesis protein CcmH/NrfG